MIYLSGVVRSDLPSEIGLMVQPGMGNAASALGGRTWGADNGCFSKSVEFDLDAYLRWLTSRLPYVARCLFATAPDVLGDAGATLARSLPVLPMIRALGYPAALVAQNGLECEEVPWVEFDALFIGGTTTWKLSPAVSRLVTSAKARGKWVHMGRVNSGRRIQAAVLMGCDSVDGTYLAFGPDINMSRMMGWLTELRRAPFLPWTLEERVG